MVPLKQPKTRNGSALLGQIRPNCSERAAQPRLGLARAALTRLGIDEENSPRGKLTWSHMPSSWPKQTTLSAGWMPSSCILGTCKHAAQAQSMGRDIGRTPQTLAEDPGSRASTCTSFCFNCERSGSCKSELRAFSVPATHVCSCGASVVGGNMLMLVASPSLIHEVKWAIFSLDGTGVGPT